MLVLEIVYLFIALKDEFVATSHAYKGKLHHIEDIFYLLYPLIFLYQVFSIFHLLIQVMRKNFGTVYNNLIKLILTFNSHVYKSWKHEYLSGDSCQTMMSGLQIEV